MGQNDAPLHIAFFQTSQKGSFEKLFKIKKFSLDKMKSCQDEFQEIYEEGGRRS